MEQNIAQGIAVPVSVFIVFLIINIVIRVKLKLHKSVNIDVSKIDESFKVSKLLYLFYFFSLLFWVGVFIYLKIINDPSLDRGAVPILIIFIALTIVAIIGESRYLLTIKDETINYIKPFGGFKISFSQIKHIETYSTNIIIDVGEKIKKVIPIKFEKSSRIYSILDTIAYINKRELRKFNE